MSTVVTQLSASSKLTGLRSLADLDGPRGVPLLGNSFQFGQGELHQVLEGWFERHGDPYKFRIGRTQGVAIGNANMIRAVLQQRPGAFRRTHRVEDVFRELGINGVFSADGDDWQRQRRLMMPSFRASQLDRFFPIVARIAGNLLERCETAAATGEPVDILALMTQFSVDVTTEISFGYPLNTLAGENGELQRHLAHVFPGIIRRVLSPVAYWRWLRLPRDRRLDQSLAFLLKSIREIVRQARTELKNNPELLKRPVNLLQVLLAPPELSSDQAPSEEEIFANVLTLLLAGEDTTANGLAWALHHLAADPQVQLKAANEAKAQLGANHVVSGYAELRKLPYISAVTEEVMRVRSPAPFIFAEAKVDTVIGDLALPANTLVAIMTRHGAMTPELFSQPTAFVPERWTPNFKAGEDNWKHTPRAQLAFGGGPRGCPGRSLALLETHLVLSALLRRFEFVHAAPVNEVTERFDFTMRPKNLSLRLSVRE